MSLLLCMLLLLILFQMRKQEDNYMEKEQCNGIKGIFIVLVFIRHVLQYITKAEADLCTLWDAPCLLVDHLLGQLIVALFLFYSGFGVMESFKQKGSSYVSSMPRKRIIGTLLNFDVAVLCFVLVDLCLGVEITWKQTILSFVAWDSVGNSNWYIFTILLCYTLSYGIFRLGLFNESGHRHVWVIGGGSLFLLIMLVLSYLKPFWWYDTMLCFPAGMFFSTYRNAIDSIFKKYYLHLGLMTLLGFILIYNCPFDKRSIVYNMRSILFSLLVVMLTMKVKIGNRPLYWLGLNLFPLYIYQRIPMIVLYEIDGGTFVRFHHCLYVLLCVLITLLLTRIYKVIEIKM